MVVTISHAGYVKRTPMTTYRAQKRGGKGKVGMEAREEDWVSQLFVASTHSYVFFFSDRGKVFVKKVYEIPAAARTRRAAPSSTSSRSKRARRSPPSRRSPRIAEGTFVVTLDEEGSDQEDRGHRVRELPRKGHHRRQDRGGRSAASPPITDGKRELVIATKGGMSIRFPEEQVRPMGRGDDGREGHRARERRRRRRPLWACASQRRRIARLPACSPCASAATASRLPSDEFRLQSRGGKGVILIDASERNGPVVGVAMVGPRTGHPGHRSRARCCARGRRDPRDRPQRPGRAPDGCGRRRARRGHRGLQRRRRRELAAG
jgi:DNA gyrase subunit A